MTPHYFEKPVWNFCEQFQFLKCSANSWPHTQVLKVSLFADNSYEVQVLIRDEKAQ